MSIQLGTAESPKRSLQLGVSCRYLRTHYDQMLFTLQIRKHFSRGHRQDLQGETAVEDSLQSSCSKFVAKSERKDCFVTSSLQNSVNINTLQTYLKNAPTQKLNLRTRNDKWK
jgi:hypothetical protein